MKSGKLRLVWGNAIASVAIVSALGLSTATHADELEEPEGTLLGALIGGEITLNVRSRVEFADIDGRKQAEALTLRTRLGYGTKPWKGFSMYADFENIVAVNDSGYFDSVETDNGKTVIADPEQTEVNQAYVKYSNEKLLGSSVTGGLQRIILDDARFVGHVGWRQNEQTYGAAVLRSSFGLDEMKFTYGYLWDIHRIFGDQGPPGTRDFDSDSHLISLSYSGLDALTATAFVYLLDFDNSPQNSSNSFGFRLNGSTALGENWTLGYIGSYAYQTDAANNSADYQAHYYNVDGKIAYKPVGAMGVGFEVLGSDNGAARFVTPLATAHKFNGWADVFLNNGGVNGLRDLYAYFVPKLPWQLKGKLAYHHFTSDQGGKNLGNEIDASISRSFLGHFTLLAKAAYFDAGGDTAPPDRYRFWLQLTFEL